MCDEININNTLRNNSTANFDFSIDEIEVKGITMRGLKMSASADITDENVKISTSGAVELFKMIFNFADAKLDKVIDCEIESQKKRTESRIKLDHAEIAQHEAQAEYWKKKTEQLNKEEE